MSTIIYTHNASSGKVVVVTTPPASTGVITYAHDNSSGRVKRTDK